MGKESAECHILITKTLGKTRSGHFPEPFVSRSILPLREPARDISAADVQPAFAVALTANRECGVPQPSRSAEPIVE